MTQSPTDLSLWWNTLPADLAVPIGAPLPGDAIADIAIVGAGFTGLWTAYYLLKANPSLRVAIVEANYAGFGASGRNGGWVSALFPVGINALARASSRTDAVRMNREMFATVTEIGRVATAEGWDINWQQGGTVVLARTPLQLESARAEIADYRAWGFGEGDYALLDATAAKNMANATDVLGGTFTPHCAAINPALLVRNLARTVTAMGAKLYEDTRVEIIEPGILRTARGSIRAEVIVRATEGYTPSLAGEKRTLAPFYSLMLATEPLSEQVWASIGLGQRQTFSDGRHLIIYGQRTADGRLAFGGRGAPYFFGSKITPAQDRNPDVHAGLWRVLTDLFPAVSEVRVTHTWGGPLGIARDWWASCGFDHHTGLAWAGGYVGDGVATTNLAGRTLTELITGQVQSTNELTTLPWVNHRSPKWEPEPLRWLATNLALRAITSADVVEERTGRPSRRAEILARKTGH